MSEHELAELRRVNPVSTDEIAPVVLAHCSALADAMAGVRLQDPEDRLRRGRPLAAVPVTATDADRPRRRLGRFVAAAAAIVVLAVPAIVFVLATGPESDVVDTPTVDLPTDDDLSVTDELPAADPDVIVTDDSDGGVFSPSPASTTATTAVPPSTDARPDTAAGAGQAPVGDPNPADPAAEPDGDVDDATDVVPAPAPDPVPTSAAAPAPRPTTAPTTPVTAAPPATAPAASPATTAAPTSGATPISARTTSLPFDPAADLLVVTLDFGHRDDGHAAVATRELATRFDLTPLVVAGTRDDDQAVVHDYAEIMRAAWGSGWIDAADRGAAVDASADRWLSTIDAGGVVRIAEGGVSDFTADVLREVRLRRPALDTTSRIAVVHHSVRNEEETRAGDLDLLRADTTMIRIDDGNNANDTADLNGSSSMFETAALAGSHRDAWRAAFDFFDAASLDFSDTVTVLHVLGIGLDQIANADDFATVVIAL